MDFNLEDIRGYLYKVIDEVIDFGYDLAEAAQDFLDEVTSDA